MSDESERRARFISSALIHDDAWREPVAPGAEIKREGTLERIKARWAPLEEAQRNAVARRTVGALTFSIQLAPPVPARQVRPLPWGNRKAGR